MNIKKYLVLVAILCIFISVFLLLLRRFKSNNYNKSGSSNPIPFLKNQSKTTSVKINNLEIEVDIADTAALQTKGLSGRSRSNEKEGMLFIFPDNKIRYFWMKDMLIPIDIIWINKERKIIGIEKNAPYPEVDTKNYKLPIYTSPQPVSYVLEVNAGFSESHNITINDVIQINQ